jgi:hypothetical protein
VDTFQLSPRDGHVIGGPTGVETPGYYQVFLRNGPAANLLPRHSEGVLPSDV